MDDLKSGDIVEVKATGKRGKVDTVRTEEPCYLIMFDNDRAAIEWKKTDEIFFIERPKSSQDDEHYITPVRPIMDGT
jgi:hypothetical protein